MSTYTNILLHLVFSTRDRLPTIAPQIRPRLYEYLGGAVNGNGGIPYSIGGTADHVHLLIRWRPNEDVSTLLREIKSGSSKWVHDQSVNLRHFAWQKEYGAFSVSYSQRNTVIKYIENQEQHHQTRTFQSEFIRILKANEIKYDERYIWN